MSDGSNNNLANPDLWIRLVYMIVFGLLSWLARIVVIIIAAIQFVLVLFSGEQNKNLQILGDGIAVWTCQTFQFLTFGTEQKPYPFQDWPEAESNREGAPEPDSPGDDSSPVDYGNRKE